MNSSEGYATRTIDIFKTATVEEQIFRYVDEDLMHGVYYENVYNHAKGRLHTLLTLGLITRDRYIADINKINLIIDKRK